jgi:hypothetical protein
MAFHLQNPEFLTGSAEMNSMLIMTELTTALLWQEACEKGLPQPDGILLVATTSQQSMALMTNATIERVFKISTSKYGMGNMIDSYKTPPGFHEVVERYGDGQAPGAEFFEREPTGRVIPESDWQAASGQDLILTRILRLGGLEEGVNRGGQIDTYERYIYLHGSDNEHALGTTPVSHGCLHLGNHEIIELYNRVVGLPAWVWIGETCRFV